MTSDEQVKEALIELGLTNAQALAYLSLVKTGKTTIKTLATAAKYDRANLYRIIAQLQNMGLVQVTLGKPNTYQALSIQDTTQLLLKKKKEKYNEIQQTINKLIEEIRKKKLKKMQIEEGTFQITPAKEGVFVVIKRVFLNAQKTHDGTMQASHYINMFKKNGTELFITCLAKGVNFRYLLTYENNREKKEVLEINKEFNNLKGTMKVKFINYLPEAMFAILDKKEVLMHTKPLPISPGSSCLHSNNVCFVGVMQQYFDELWNKAETPQF